MADSVTVEFGSPFKEIAGTGEVVIEVGEEGVEAKTWTLARLLDCVGARVEALRRLFHDPLQRKYFLCTVNGMKADEADPVRPGDEIHVSSPILGG